MSRSYKAEIYEDGMGNIIYYGNPAGYERSGELAIDAIFNTEDMQNWLEKRGKPYVFESGIMETLIKGDRLSLGKTSDIRIWQLKPDTDVFKKFASYDKVKNTFGEVDITEYECVFQGNLATNDLEKIYDILNADTLPQGYRGHSLSVSDVVELYSEDKGSFYYCDTRGFVEIEKGLREVMRMQQ